MPVQTTKKQLYFADGCKVEIADKPNDWFDVGAIASAVTTTLEFTENTVETANAGPTQKQIREMTLSGSFELINLDPEGVKRLGGGIFDLVETSAGNKDPEDQVISNVQFEQSYPIILKDSNGNNLRPTDIVNIKSVKATGNKAQTTANKNYVLIEDSSSPSGWAITFVSGTTGILTAGNDVTIEFDATEIRGSQILYMGSSTQVLNAVGMRCTHLDGAGKKRALELFAVEASSGGFQFNFKGANEDGVETMPLTFTARLDDTKTDKRQLAAWTIEDGAR